MKLIQQLNQMLEDLSTLGVIPSNPLALITYDEVELDIQELENRFKEYLNYLGYSNIEPKILSFDPNTGELLIRFTNPETKEEVDVFFTVVDNEVLAVVVSPDDEPIEVNLTNLEVPLAYYTISAGIDWDEPLTWLKKSVVSALLLAGKLIPESYHVIRGNRRERLPLVRKGKLPEIVKANLKRVKAQPLQPKFKLKKCKVS